jgi:EmrB/QacA subfamily drug resistance transporter
MNPKLRIFILLGIVMCPFVTQFDTGMVNLALPSISSKFGITSSAVIWISSIYIVFISATVLLFGKMGDSYGHFMVIRTGMLLYTVATIFAGLSNSFNTLLFARVIQAIGASAFLGNIQGAITRVFPSKESTRVFGINACFVALGTLFGPSFGGMILSRFSWNILFFSEIPFCVFILILHYFVIQDGMDGTGEKVDWRGSLYIFITVASFFISLQQSQKLGINNPIVYGGFLISTVFMISFISSQKKTTKPLLYLDLFKNKLLSTNLFCTLVSYSSVSVFNIILPFYFQKVREMTPSESGLMLAIYPLLLMFIAPLSGYISDKVRSEILTLSGLVITSIGLIGMVFVTEYTAYWIIVIILVILGLGSGLFQSLNNFLVMRSVPSGRLGIGGGLNTLARNIGINTGLAFATIILYNSISSLVGYHTTSYIADRPDAFMLGMRNAFIFAALISFVAILLALKRSLLKGSNSENMNQ